MSDILSKRGKKVLVHNGYSYVFDKMLREGRKSWRCRHRYESGKQCKGRVHSDAEDNVVDSSQETKHKHEADAARVVVERIVTGIKRRAADTQEMPVQIFGQAVAGTSQAVQGKMPKLDAIRKVVQRTRIHIRDAPVNPMTIEELVLPEEYKKYEYAPGRFDDFLLSDTGEGNQRVLVFGRRSHLQWAHQMKTVFIDGTFCIAPPLFKQVFVLLAKKEGHVFPVFYALLGGKEEVMYARALQAFKDVFPSFNPTSISLDYEPALLSATRAVFPEAIRFGCLFHLMKNLRRTLGDNRLMKRYRDEAEFALHCRMVAAIAFVEPSQVVAYFEELADFLESQDPDYMPVVNWFEDYYIGRIARNGRRRPPQFPVEVWSVYRRTLDSNDRTNNYAEAAHRRLQSEIGCAHPTIWKFIDSLRTVQAGLDVREEFQVRGDEPARKRTKYVQADENILRIVSRMNERSKLEYLRGLSHNIRME